MSYFAQFPYRTDHKIFLVNEDLTKQLEVNLSFPDFFRHVALAFPKIDDGKFFYEQIRILDRERPDQLSYRLYGTEQYYWTFFIINDKLRLGEAIQWPLSNEQINNKLDREYEGQTIVTFKSRFIKTLRPSLSFKKDNYLYNKFRIGEIVRGQTSNVTGVIVNIRPEFGQIITKNIRPEGSRFRSGEAIVGEDPTVTVICDESIKSTDAIYRYIEPATGRDVDCRNFILTDETNTVSGLEAITFREHYAQMNENLSMIRVLKKSSVQEFADAFAKLIRREPKASTMKRLQGL